MQKISFILIIMLSLAWCGYAQNADAYKTSNDQDAKGGLIDMKRLTVNHSVSYGMATGAGSPLLSQGLYTTMLTYQFTQPVTLNLDFGLPLMSSFNKYQNPTMKNFQSLDYFKSMPINMSLSWQPKENMLVELSVMRNTGYGYGAYGYYDPLSPLTYGQYMNRMTPAVSEVKAQTK